jgi:hypothetical protein
MMLYYIALFFHILGALFFAAVLAIEWFCIFNFRRSINIESIRLNILNYSKFKLIEHSAITVILVPGFYMMTEVWKGAIWIIMGFAGMVLLAVIGITITNRIMRNIKKKLECEDYTLQELNNLLNNNLFINSIKIRTTIFLGIIFLMAVKPDLAASIITLLVSIIAGLIPLKLRSYQILTKKNY